MAEQKKKTKRIYRTRANPAPVTALKADKRTYHAETTSASLSAGLGLPPLKMILVHAENDRANAAMKPVVKPRLKRNRTQQEVVIKLIEHLTKIQ